MRGVSVYMKDMGKKIFTWKPDMRLIAVLAVAALALLMVPLVRLAFYAVPYYDDYMFGGAAKVWMEQIGSPWGAVKGILESVRVEWYAWQGTYAATFFNSLMPAVWGEQYYCIGPLFLIFFLPISVCVLVRVLIKDVLKGDTASCVAIQAVTAAMVVVLVYSSQQGFYWWVGGICYVGMHSFLILLIAGWVKLLVGTTKLKAVFLVFLTVVGSIIVGGATYVTALQGILIGIGLILFGAILKRKQTWLLLPSVLFCVCGFFINVTAPGNAKRAESFEGWGYSPVQAVLRSFVEAFRYLWTFTGWITIAVMILLIPIIWHLVNRTEYKFKFPVLVLAGAFCLYATGFTPQLFALGHAGLSRTLNAVKITYQLLLILNEVYLLGWLNRCLREKGKKLPDGKVFWWFYPLMGAVMLCIFAVAPNQAGCYSSYGAYYYIHTGEAYNFHQQYKERVEILKSDVDDVVLEPYRFKPWLLCISDLSENPDNEANWAVAVWYGKNSVKVDYPE